VEIRDVLERVDRVERQLGQLRIAAGLAVVLLVAGVVITAPVSSGELAVEIDGYERGRERPAIAADDWPTPDAAAASSEQSNVETGRISRFAIATADSTIDISQTNWGNHDPIPSMELTFRARRSGPVLIQACMRADARGTANAGTGIYVTPYVDDTTAAVPQGAAWNHSTSHASENGQGVRCFSWTLRVSKGKHKVALHYTVTPEIGLMRLGERSLTVLHR
jgi:hypothetical protein